MKFLFFTDTHIRGNNPRSRKDIFVETLYLKFQEILDYINNNGIDYVLFGGDLFDRPDISLSVAQRFIELLNNFPKPIYMVLGNHDIYGQNPTTVNRTILGILQTLGIIKVLDNEPVILKTLNKTIKITGSSYKYDIDIDKNKEKYISKKEEVDYLIHIVHGMLMEKEFIKEVPHTLIDELVFNTEADITLCGHYHNGFGIKKIDNKYFVNPGALVRINNSLSEINRMPSFAVIDIDDNINIYIEKLASALKGEDVIDRDIVKLEEQKEVTFNKIIQSVSSYGSYQFISLEKIIEEIATRENIPEDVKKEAIIRLERSQISLSEKEVVD
ncbi:MAG: metallophosphoesterase [Clostridiales bacterium]|nr:metallophosphoesterase [Clostridiales bacterium]